MKAKETKLVTITKEEMVDILSSKQVNGLRGFGSGMGSGSGFSFSYEIEGEDTCPLTINKCPTSCHVTVKAKVILTTTDNGLPHFEVKSFRCNFSLASAHHTEMGLDPDTMENILVAYLVDGNSESTTVPGIMNKECNAQVTIVYHESNTLDNPLGTNENLYASASFKVVEENNAPVFDYVSLTAN